MTVQATDGTATTSKDVTVVVENVNRAPIIATVDDVTVLEGERINVNVLAADPDKDEITLSFSPPLNQNGEWQTEEGDAGIFDVTVTATDGMESAEKSFTVTVESRNKAPVIKIDDAVEVRETETVVLEPVVTDPDGDEVTVTYTGWMTSESYTTTYEDGNDDPNEYSVVIIATDGTSQTSKEVTVRVFNKNRPPEFVFG